MYKLTRVMLMSAVLACIYSVAVLTMQFEASIIYIDIGILVVGLLAKRGYGALTAHGTARWACTDDLRNAGMLDARSGLIIGRLADGGKPPLLKAACGLFSLRVMSKEACQRFLDAMRFFNRAKTYPALVRLPHAIHTAIFAPTGTGKSTSLAIPFLLTCEDSCVVVDLKGELAPTISAASSIRTVSAHQKEVPFQALSLTHWYQPPSGQEVRLLREDLRALLQFSLDFRVCAPTLRSKRSIRQRGSDERLHTFSLSLPADWATRTSGAKQSVPDFRSQR